MTADALFLLLLRRSLAAGWLILALLLVRPLLRRVSRSLCCAVWGLVAVRLLCPFSFESAFSLLPGSGALADVEAAAAFPAQTPAKVAAAIWLAGVLLLGLYAVGSYWHLRFLVQEAVKKEDGVWLCDRIDTPFILGVFRPRILLPLSMDAEDIPYVLAHERAHLARRDHWRKPIAFALLTVFWFQPVLWIAYVLLGRDIEFACDERTVRALGGDDESKARYAKALLRGSVPRTVAAKLYCPLAFGGLQTRQRVQSVLKYRRPAFALLLAAAVVCTSVAVCFLTDPKGGEAPEVAEAPTVLEVLEEEPSPLPPAEEHEKPAEKPAEKPHGELVAKPVERPTGGVFVATVEHKGTTGSGHSPETMTMEEWMACLDPSYDISEEEWRLCYVLNHRTQSWYSNEGYELPVEIAELYGTTDFEKLPSIIIYESIGELDSTETIHAYFTGRDENGNRWEWDDTVTVDIPAGGLAFCVLDPGFEAESGGFEIIAGSYGNLYVNPYAW